MKTFSDRINAVIILAAIIVFILLVYLAANTSANTEVISYNILEPRAKIQRYPEIGVYEYITETGKRCVIVTHYDGVAVDCSE